MAYSTSPLVTRFNRHLSHDGEHYRFHPIPGAEHSIELSDEEVEVYTLKLEDRSAWLMRSTIGAGIAALLLVYFGMFSGLGKDFPLGRIYVAAFAMPLIIAVNLYSWTVRPLLRRAKQESTD